jgi:hypothetical protein
MRETLELRVSEEEAWRCFRPDEGVRLGEDVRKVMLPLPDERLPRINEINQELRKKGRSLFWGWSVHRRYSEKELQAAELFKLWPNAVFEPAGEDCGTEYDESVACPECGTGARQASDLVLDLRRAPKGADMARTIADELIISTRLAEELTARGLRGAEFRPVRQAGKKGTVSSVWLQLVVSAIPAEVVAPTSTGVNPFDRDGQGKYRCPRGDLAGLNLLSELFVARGSYDGSDLSCTRQSFGARRNEPNPGVLRPSPYLLISPKLRGLLVESRVRRLEIEVAHLV